MISLDEAIWHGQACLWIRQPCSFPFKEPFGEQVEGLIDVCISYGSLIK